MQEGVNAMNRRTLLGLTSLVVLALLLTGCLNLFAPKTQTVSGTVRYESGAPIAGADVKLGTMTAKTNAQGQFQFTNVRQGTYDLTVSIGGTQVHATKVTVGNQPVTLTIKLPDPEVKGTIRGIVQYADGTPIPNVTVRLGELTAQSDAEGKYEFADVPYGTYTITATVDEHPYSATVELNSALAEGVDIIVTVKLIYAEDFSGAGSSPADFGLTTTAGTWSIEASQGKRWLKGQHNGVASANVQLAEIGTADRVIFEYRLMPLSGNAGVLFAANSGTAGQGGKGYFSFHITATHSMRFIGVETNNAEYQAARHDSSEGKAVANEAMLVRIELDRTAKTLDMLVNGTRATGYPLTLTDDLVFTGADHTWFRFYLNNSSAQWTDLKVWVSVRSSTS